MKHTRGRLVGNVVASVGGWPGLASGIWNRNDVFAGVRGNTWPVYSSIPGAPAITGVSRVAGSGTSVDVTFTAPASNGGQTITSYTAVSTPGNVTASLSQAGSGTIRVTGLTQGTSYTFVVYATSVVGNSPNSAASNVIIPATVPGTPTIGTPTRVSGSGTEIDVPFSAPANDGGLPITSYTVTYTYTGGSGGQSISQSGSGTLRVTGLTQGTSYTFRVYATNAIGDSPSSAASAAIIPATVPGAPTIGTATATSGSTATVAYTAPASNGGLAITSYTAVSSPGGITGTLSQPGSGTITVNGLSFTTTYTFQVYATNAVGNSPNSASSNQTTTLGAGPTSIDYLVVGGGGAGGWFSGAGGGAGGYRTGNASVSSAITYTITIGAGGSGGTGDGAGGPGSGSSISGSGFTTITSAGGGGGGTNGNGDNLGYGRAGGSGGGGSAGQTFGAGNTPATTPSQGNNGGASGVWSPPYYNCGGGGGAGAAGLAGDSGKSGGIGIQSSISGTATYYAGGGGGGSYSGTGSPGGQGGGGSGVQSGPAGSGTANTGGGGGGGGFNQTNNNGAGGSGIVIIRYLNTFSDASSTTGSPTFTNTGGYKIYTWTGSGTIRW